MEGACVYPALCLYRACISVKCSCKLGKPDSCKEGRACTKNRRDWADQRGNHTQEQDREVDSVQSADVAGEELTVESK